MLDTRIRVPHCSGYSLSVFHNLMKPWCGNRMIISHNMAPFVEISAEPAR